MQKLEEAYALSQGRSMRRGSLEWPARLPDLTLRDFFLLGFLKRKIYSARLQNLKELEQRIRASSGLITQDLLQNVGR